MMINKIDTSPIALDEVMSGNTAQEPGLLFSKTSIGRCYDSRVINLFSVPFLFPYIKQFDQTTFQPLLRMTLTLNLAAGHKS